MEKVLTYGDVKHTDYGHSTTVRISLSLFKIKRFENGDRNVTFGDRTYNIPGWSVGILPDCKSEVYNTAEVNTQTTIREKVSSQRTNKGFKWQWRSEKIEHMTYEDRVDGSVITANRLLDQKVVTNDASDYLWYLTGFHLEGSDPLFGKRVKLRVNTRGHILHAVVNKKHIGKSQYALKSKYNFIFEKEVRNLRHGFNQIVLLSATVGLPHYGAHFEDVEAGVHGPVELVADGETIRTTFQTPKKREGVVVDLLGMGKGHAWVNGKSIGRYWPSYLANENDCSSHCDFRGAYYDNKCVTNCGKPTQRWYHIPRSYLNKGKENTLILFEEFGGVPLNIDIQITRVKKVCAKPYAGSTLELSCHDRTIKNINFVSFGNPHGNCDNFQKGTCDSSTALSVIEKACLGKRKCSIEVTKSNLGNTGCKKHNRLAVQVTC
ncbi:beta-galactosidase-like [Cucumis melo var. makuwa]|uniref:Beta-galactosidase-like n=1 Tax=Cucumis melo var. makuwa TaxID=1194695 RepID=A0A5A7SI46_CUCMM|nr:beta-galactosidase-like [Cucumis melo var. makuwa]